jgi:hypothetical protein
MSGTFSAVTLAMVDLSEKKKSLEAQLGKLTGQAPAPQQEPAAGDTPKPKPEDPKPAGAKPEDSKPDTPAKQSEIARIKAELVQVNDELRKKVSQIVPDMPGVTGSVVRSSALGITLRQAFAEPVVIGYRGIHFKIASLNPKSNSGSSSPKPIEPDDGSVAAPLQILLPGIRTMTNPNQKKLILQSGSCTAQENAH